MAVGAINPNSFYTVTKTNDSTIINYDDPNMIDEECTYTFNSDGSATCVSNAWGTKTSLPAGTFVDDGKQSSPEEMVNLYRSYQEYKKLDIQA